MAKRFSKKTIDFLQAAGSEKSTTWLAAHKREHMDVLVEPLRDLALHLSRGLAKIPEARVYKIPRQGFGRLRRPKKKIGVGQPAYRNWVTLKSSPPSNSIFDENPGLYFFASPKSISAGGGLYDPSSRQIKKLRAWLAEGPKELDRLLKSKTFKAEFPDGLEMDRVLKTFPRFYPQDHKHIERLKLQAFYVNRDFSKREFYSAEFPDLILENWKQTLRFNSLLFEELHAISESFVSNEPGDEATDEAENDSEIELWDDRL